MTREEARIKIRDTMPEVVKAIIDDRLTEYLDEIRDEIWRQDNFDLDGNPR